MGFQFHKKLLNKANYLTMALMIAVASLVGASGANASNADWGYVSNITVLPGGAVVFNHSGTRTTIPTCASSYPTRWAFNVNTTVGQAQLSTLVSAFGMGKQIVIIGSGACSDWSDTESLVYFTVSG